MPAAGGPLEGQSHAARYGEESGGARGMTSAATA
jgi:hypothetical protein